MSDKSTSPELRGLDKTSGFVCRQDCITLVDLVNEVVHIVNDTGSWENELLNTPFTRENVKKMFWIELRSIIDRLEKEHSSELLDWLARRIVQWCEEGMWQLEWIEDEEAAYLLEKYTLYTLFLCGEYQPKTDPEKLEALYNAFEDEINDDL